MGKAKRVAEGHEGEESCRGGAGDEGHEGEEGGRSGTSHEGHEGKEGGCSCAGDEGHESKEGGCGGARDEGHEGEKGSRTGHEGYEGVSRRRVCRWRLRCTCLPIHFAFGHRPTVLTGSRGARPPTFEK